MIISLTRKEIKFIPRIELNYHIHIVMASDNENYYRSNLMHFVTGPVCHNQKYLRFCGHLFSYFSQFFAGGRAGFHTIIYCILTILTIMNIYIGD